VQFRLFPYLEDLEIDPIPLVHNTVVTGVVDYYTIDRTTDGANPFIQYYVVNPGIKGYENGIAFGQALLSEVTGGQLTLRVMGGHLATPEQAYIPGDIVALTQDHVLYNNMQSGRYPYTYQWIMDSRTSIYQPECDGSTDFCGTTTGFDPNSNYETDTSISFGFLLAILILLSQLTLLSNLSIKTSEIILFLIHLNSNNTLITLFSNPIPTFTRI